jgi:hypothetical protein
MSHAIANANAFPATAGVPSYFESSPSFGVADYDSALAFGANAFTVFLAINTPLHSNSGATFGGLGQPLFNFTELWQSGGNAGKPKNGWGIWVGGSYVKIQFQWYNAYDYADASKWGEWGLSPSGDVSGKWNLIGFSKLGSLRNGYGSCNGATVYDADEAGTATTIGTPMHVDAANGVGVGTKVRYFHSVGAGVTPTINATFAGAAGLWIANGALTQAQLNAITANVTAFKTAVDTTYLSSIVARTYADGQDWSPIQKQPTYNGRNPYLLIP